MEDIEIETASRVNFITCVKWVKKGAAKQEPDKVQLSKAELIQVIRDTQEKLRVTSTGNIEGQQSTSGQDEFNLENYDENDESDANALGIGGLAELPADEADDNFSESDDSDKEDEVIKPTDNLILVGHVEGDASSLEVYIYNEEEESLYVHHDLLLPAFPLCFEWLDYEANAPKGNYCAVGSMTPIIQVWDLDIINCIEPAFSLGQNASVKKRRPQIGHTDAVLTLAWNKSYEHVLASGSVDQTIILWDLENKKPSTTIEAFNEKVQCLQWHRLEAQTLLAGGADKFARIFDCRTPEPYQSWQLDGEAEQVAWNPLQPFTFYVGTNLGTLQLFDCRKGQLWSTCAHSKEITGLVVSGQCPGLVVTSSPDGLVKTWDCDESQAKLVHEKNFNLGEIQCLDLCSDFAFVIAAGGDNKSNNFIVHDLRNIDAVKHTFESKQLVELISGSGFNHETFKEEMLEEENIDQSISDSFFSNLSFLIISEQGDKKSRNFPVEDYREIIRILERNGYNTDTLMAELAQPCDKMLQLCLWKTKEKECGQIFKLTKTTAGYCCSFNYKEATNSSKNHANIYGSGVGPLFGLEVHLNPDLTSQNHEFSSSPHESIGADVIIHENINYPDLLLMTTAIYPDRKMSLGVKPEVLESEKNLQSIDVPTRGCIFPSEVKLSWAVGYTYSNCMIECKAQAIVSLCGCIPYYYPTKGLARYCTLLDMDCLNEKMSQHHDNKYSYGNHEELNDIGTLISACDCYPQCNEVTYGYEIDEESLKKETNDTTENPSVLVVYFSHVTCLKIKRSEYLTWESILASIGGLIGLCLGGSILSVIEFLYHIIETVFRTYSTIGVEETKKNGINENSPRYSPKLYFTDFKRTKRVKLSKPVIDRAGFQSHY